MFKFVASDGTGSIKRHQAQKACDSCRKRKKRCNHGSNAILTNSSPVRGSSQVNSDERVSQPAKPYTASILSCTTDAGYQSTTSHEEPGHISPVASTLASSDQDLEAARILSGGTRTQANTSHSQEPTGVQSRFIGDLNPESIFLAATSPDAIRGVLPDSVGVYLSSTLGKKPHHFSNLQQTSSNLFYGCPPLVRNVLVPLIEQECLSTMPPIPHLEALSRIYFEKINTIFPIINETTFRNLAPSVPCRALLEQAICLAASKSFAAADHLILDEAGPPMTCKAFGEKVSSAMRLTIELGIVTDKIVLIQALCLLSLFIDNSSSEDLASQFSGKATHYLEGMGLHLEGQVEDASAKLLCCVYALDRMNAAFHGRPVLMHERDMRRDLHQCFNQQEPSFRLFLKIISLLDDVIEIYRPPNQSEQGGMDVRFPAFEELVLDCAAAHIGTSSLATIEIFYHSISIISHRSHIWSEPKRSTPSYLRQALSTSILSSTTPHELQDQLVLFPFVPYAISLSLSIAYREMRHNKLPVHRMRARGQFQASCRLLEGLESQYSTAANAANMGKKMLREIDRVFSTVSSENKTTAPQQDISNTTENSSIVNDHSTSVTNTENQSIASASNAQVTPSIAPIYTGMQDFDPSLFDLNATGDIDLFSMFDPSFDLVGFDACLEGNLNLGFPTPAPHP
ncbi:hypothetical protein BELL_0016g00040 [Botrytis elliptica]|uniref:Xylanolytic transcriptional activator regulatory domain-containing protein n=1 Tax=Botrytis elliptica TaxID=278938 RepID=A0A4Z1K7I8_9HELO|nr:hypothetical protein EAE99_010380 [Botrytis elliptica]TGO80030.1 hypothetical protein BELL_0016g00040 [Botrytis elliptica]